MNSSFLTTLNLSLSCFSLTANRISNHFCAYLGNKSFILDFCLSFMSSHFNSHLVSFLLPLPDLKATLSRAFILKATSGLPYFSIEVKVTQSCQTLCDPMDYTVPGILQARILTWVALLFSRESSQPRDQTQVSRSAGGFFTSGATSEAQEYWCR